MIVRSPRHERDFTILSNTTLRDGRLSFKARGLLAYLLSHPPGYRVRADDLADTGPDGRDAVRSGLAELEAAGYLVRTTSREADGRYVHDSVVYEEPVAGQPEAGEPAPGNPPSVRAALSCVPAGDTRSGFPHVGKPGPEERRTEVRRTEELELAAAPPSTPALFPTPPAPPPPRTPDLLFEAVAVACGIDWHQLTGVERGRVNKAVGELRAVGADPAQVATRATNYRLHFDGAALTPMGLAGRWAQCERPPAPKPTVVDAVFNRLNGGS